MNFVFREPDFPLLVESDIKLLSAYTKKELIQVIRSSDFKLKDSYAAIDLKGEGWSYFHDLDALSPLTFKKRWYKKEIIELCNRFIQDDANKFVGKLLSTKTLPKLIIEIIEHTSKA